MTDNVLVASDICVTGPDGRRIVDAVNLSLRSGSIAGLTGRSGAGKSVLAHALLGLARAPLSLSGSVEIDGVDLITANPVDVAALRGRRIALVMQNPRAALHPMVPVGRQIGRIWQAHHRGNRQLADARAIEMLRLVGINDAERRAGAFVHELSGGMAQRALIAAALASDPAVLIADEPTSGLDVTVQADFLDMMAKAARERETAMLLITQEPGILANYCDRVLIMEDGRLAADKTIGIYFMGAYDHAAIVPEPVRAPRVVEARALTKTFPVRGSRAIVHAVDGVDLDVAEGETLGLVGESGSGKTTAGRTLIRLIEPDSGRVSIASDDISNADANRLRTMRAKIQLVAQDPFDSFDPRWTIAKSIAEPLVAQGWLKEDIAPRIEAVLALVGAPSLGAARPAQLSAGELQRVAVARALAVEPKFVVLDEPTSMLPPDARTELISLLTTLQKKTATAFLFISHDLTTVAAVSHRVSVMYLGQIVESGETRHVFERPRHPYTRALIAAHLTVDLHHRRIDTAPSERLQGEIPSPIDLPEGCYLASRCHYAVERCRSERQQLTEDSLGAIRCWRVNELPPFERVAAL